LTDQSESPRKIKVVDRRWFTGEGELRDDRAADAAAPVRNQSLEQPADAPAAPSERPPQSAPTTSQAFLELVASLAQQAELFLTGAQGLPAQPAQAQRIIDYLGELETKTRGNLSAEETQILSGVIFELRSRFVKRGR
jgi:hypothetical protein